MSIDNHKDPATGKIDWASYGAAQAEAKRLDTKDGVYCYRCGAYMLGRQNGRQMCGQCQHLDQPEELTHDHLIRCPQCGNVHRPEDLYESGRHETLCPECDCRFEVEVHVSYSFTSPERATAAVAED